MAVLPPNEYPCSSYKTITIILQAPDVAPANGYSVRWRVVGSTIWNDYPVQYGTTISVIGVPACYNIEVGIKANCDGGAGTEVFTLVQGTNSNCYVYTLNDNTIYSYTPCGADTPVSIEMNSLMTGASRQVCAREGTITGGGFTQSVLCTG